MQATSTEFRADALNAERSFVLRVRAESENNNNKSCTAFSIFRVAQVVASFCPLPPFELKGELVEAFKKYNLERKALSTADRYALSRVTRIGDRFLCYCVKLNAIDLSPLSNLTRIGDGFLLGCTELKTIDLSPLSNVTSIGDHFLSCCASLKTIDLSPFSNVTSIGDHFLSNCTGLKTIDLSPLSNLTIVGDGFLDGCSGNVQAQCKEFLSRRGIK